LKAYYLKLSNKITLAFVALGLAIAIAGGIGLHYLDGIRLYQLQFEDEWEEYQRMVIADDVLKMISTDISAWQAGMLPVNELKLKSKELVHILSSWSRNEQEEEKIVDLVSHEQQEAYLLVPAREAFIDLTKTIDTLKPKPTPSTTALLIHSLNQLQESNQPLRQFYFDSIKVSLGKAKKARFKVESGGVYFIAMVTLLLLAISMFSVKVIKRQTKQLMEQERQIASVTLVQQLAHEIRNPLGIVKSAASVIAKRSTGEVVMLAKDISLEVERVDGLLTDLLHLRQGDNKPKVSTDISALVMRVAELFTSKIRAANLRLDVYNKASGALVSCHPEAIKQVIMNLLLNAIEASSENSSIEMTMMVVGKDYMVQVRDYGTGLDPKVRQRIFDLMYTTKPYGFGIGLTVVKRIVDDHGGRIEVSNPSPRGCAFTIYLPMGA